MVRREKAAERVAAEAAAYAKERETKGARRGQGAHSRFRTAFTKAMEGAKGLERREVARAVAQATARFLSDHVDGRTIERLTGIYARHELTRCRYEGGRLAAEVEVSPGKVRDPLAVLNYRCGEGVAA